MKESYSEDLASHAGLEFYADGGNVIGVATAEVYAGELLSSEITFSAANRGHAQIWLPQSEA